MDYKDRALEIYKTEAEKYKHTRDIEWKMNIAVWTVVAASVYAKYQNPAFFSTWHLCGYLIVGLFYVAIHIGFIVGIQKSLGRSLDRMHNIGKFILEKPDTHKLKWEDVEKTRKEREKQEDKKESNDRTLFWVIIECSPTAFLIVIFIFFK